MTGGADHGGPFAPAHSRSAAASSGRLPDMLRSKKNRGGDCLLCFCSNMELLQAVLDCDGNGDGGADHGVVAHAEEAHHLHVRAMLSGCSVRPVPPPEATEKYFLPCSTHSFL